MGLVLRVGKKDDKRPRLTFGEFFYTISFLFGFIRAAETAITLDVRRNEQWLSNGTNHFTSFKCQFNPTQVLAAAAAAASASSLCPTSVETSDSEVAKEIGLLQQTQSNRTRCVRAWVFPTANYPLSLIVSVVDVFFFFHFNQIKWEKDTAW